MKELSVFPTGEKNTAYAKYFIGQSYLYPLSTEQVHISNVTFEPGCRNNWHVHTAKKGGGQILICTAGEGWYQEWGQTARRLKPGDVVNIPTGVKHWTAPRKTAGSSTSPSQRREKNAATNGSNLYLTKITASLTD